MISVFGSINVDLAIRVARLPAAGETVIGPSYAVSAGGKGGNQALAARRAGAKVALYGAVGRDDYAGEALALLRHAGVSLDGVREDAGARTGVAAIAIDEHGENQIVVASGANAAARAADLPPGAFAPGDLMLLQLELPPDEVRAAAERARRSGMRVVLNLAPALDLPESTLDVVDVLVLNEGEATVLARHFALHEAGPKALARAIAERRHGAVVVTAGAQGVFFAQNRFEVEHVAAPAVAVVDTTGAGDAFVGTLAATLDGGGTLRDAVRRGAAAGALACTAPGAQSSLPSAAEIDALAAVMAAGQPPGMRPVTG